MTVTEDNDEKKTFSEERANKLALARQKALEVRRRNKEDKMRAELEKMELSRKETKKNHLKRKRK